MEIAETNSSNFTITTPITNLNFGYSTYGAAGGDAANVVAANFPISAATSLGRSWQKWIRFKCSSMGGSTYITNLKVYLSSTPSALGSSYVEVRTNCSSTQTVSLLSSMYALGTSTGGLNSSGTESTYGGFVVLSSLVPVTGNVLIGGANSSWITSTAGAGGSAGGGAANAGWSDYMIFQIYASSSAQVGTTLTFNFQYDEVA
jgi:hypothetical protein